MNSLRLSKFAFFLFVFTSITYTSPVKAEKQGLNHNSANIQACGCNNKKNRYHKPPKL